MVVALVPLIRLQSQKAGDPKDNTIEVLVVGGGGSGGKWSGGGGGAGGVAHTYNYTLDHPAFPGSGPWAFPFNLVVVEQYKPAMVLVM